MDSGGYGTDCYGDSDSEDDMFNFGGFNPYGVAMGDMCDGMFNEVYNNYGVMGFDEDMFDYMDDHCSLDEEDDSENEGSHGTRLSEKKALSKRGLQTEPKVKRHPAILRTNRQIYNEASALLHSDLTIDMDPGDALIDTPGNATMDPTREVWRHTPVKGLGIGNVNGQTVYESSPLDGSLEPHIFARFERVSYNAYFDFNLDHAASPSLYVNDDLSVRSEGAAKFVSYLTTAKGTTRWFEDPIPGRPFDNSPRETPQDVAHITISSVTATQPSTAEIILKFVNLLSISPLIRHLEFVLDIEARYNDSLDDLSWDSDNETDSERDATDDEKAAVANERATELFLESSVLDSLRTLSNVKCFSLVINTYGRGGEVMKPQQKHLKIIRDLKEVIEKNWVVKPGPR